MGTVRSRPPPYYYGQAYVAALAATASLSFGIWRPLWEYFVFALGFAVLAVAGLAYLGWWRRSYDEWHPDEPDTETSWLNRTASSWALNAVVRIFRRGHD